MKVIFVCHPRTKKFINKYNLLISNSVKMISPLGFLDFLLLEKYAGLIMTDSGGIQEEACILKVPCVTLRDNTERPETIRIGANILVGVETENIIESAKIMCKRLRNWENPYGNGESSEIIYELLKKLAF